MRDYQYEEAAALGYEGAMANISMLLISNGTLGCPARSFNLSQHQHTFVTEVGVVGYVVLCVVVLCIGCYVLLYVVFVIVILWISALREYS